MKRFTETEKWRDPWYRRLPPAYKCLWQYICDNCDQAGIWEPDFETASYFIGETIDEEKAIEAFQIRIERLSGGKWRIIKFVKFQYGCISRDCKPHKPVFACIEKHGLQIEPFQMAVPIMAENGKAIDTFPIGFQSLQEKEKDKDKEKDKEQDQPKPSGKTLHQLRAERLFKRRESTPWDSACIRAWGKSRAAIEATPEDDWLLLEWFYSIPPQGTFRRHDLATLLNNWTAEIDRARNFKAGGGTPANANATHQPSSTRSFSQRNDYSVIGQ